jgi:hypothetical protein
MKPCHLPKTTALLALSATLCITPAISTAQDTPKPPENIPAANERILSVESAKKEQIRHSMTGFTTTRLFYTIADQKAVLILKIDNSNTTFPTTATVVLFAPDATEENIAKWINNQHSDGLFIDPAEPISTTTLPPETCSVKEHEKLVEQQKNPSDQTPYNDYKVKLSIKEHHEPNQFKLTAFDVETNVFVKAEAL